MQILPILPAGNEQFGKARREWAYSGRMRGKMALFDKSMNTLKKNKEQEQNQNLMKLIKRVHSVVENTDIEKHRQSQDYFGALLGSSKDMDICPVEVEGMHCEWVRTNRVHMKKYVILLLSRRRLFHRELYLCENPDNQTGSLHTRMFLL